MSIVGDQNGLKLRKDKEEKKGNMTRPDYPNCVMTPGVIRGVQERQRAYDKDPKAYEAEEKRHEEQKVMEREELTRINKEEDKERR